MSYKDKKRFSIKARLLSFGHAFRGLKLFFEVTHNSWVHIVALGLTIGLGFFFQISLIQWLSLVIVSGFVLVTEAINTAIEIDIDLTSPEFHPFAKDTKDVAAAAVLLSSVTALIVGLIIFVPHFIWYFNL